MQYKHEKKIKTLKELSIAHKTINIKVNVAYDDHIYLSDQKNYIYFLTFLNGYWMFVWLLTIIDDRKKNNKKLLSNHNYYFKTKVNINRKIMTFLNAQPYLK